ncbi:MAG: VOC family protein [Gemmatimonadetes bacterium]|nr:VOC family protein [Gemmatimonadota bacterium]MCC6773325.1 VOC family protein [Gemmatimonadaceae bacterium]
MHIWPLLMTSSIQRSLAFYRDRLGFTVVGRDAERDEDVRWCRVARDGASLMLQQADVDQSPATSSDRRLALYIVCDDVDALHADFSARGLQLPVPVNAYYSMRQLEVPDPDGYAVCFETPLQGWQG